VRLYRQAIDRRAVIVSDNSRSIPCISCEGAGYSWKRLVDFQDEETCSHCKGTGLEPVVTMTSGFEGSIPPINMPKL